MFDHTNAKLILKAVAVSIGNPPKFKGIFDISTLFQIILSFSALLHPLVFKSLYLLAFLGFLRNSNLLPSSRLSFDLKKQLCRGEVIIEVNYAIILLKWSKTLQASNQESFIMIPQLGKSPLCPVKSLMEMQKAYPANDNDSLFCIQGSPVT